MLTYFLGPCEERCQTLSVVLSPLVGMRKGYERGRLEGREEGILEGMEKGLTKGILLTAAKLKLMGLSTQDIQKATGLSVKVIEGL